jgi:hypothetical protein
MIGVRTWLRITALVGLPTLISVRIHELWVRGPTEFDDAYMYLRYARHLRAGYGLAWNPGAPPVHGVTSLPHLLVTTALTVLFPRLPDGALLVVGSLAAAVLAMVVLALAGAGTVGEGPLARHRLAVGAALVPIAIFSDPFTFHATSGMDTMLSCTANALVALAAVHLRARPTTRAALLAALAGYGAALTRPDNLLVAALVPALTIALACPPPRGRLLAAFALPLASLVALDLTLKRVLLGTALPLSFWAKRPGHYGGFVGEHGWNPYRFLEVFLRGALPLLGALVLGVGRQSACLVLALLVPVAATFLALGQMNQIMGHLGRFYYPFLPFLAVAAVEAAGTALPGAMRAPPPPRRVAVRVVGALAALLLGAISLRALAASYDARARAERLADLDDLPLAAVRPLPELDSFAAARAMGELLRASPPGTSCAMSEHGLPGARAPEAVIIDVLGLHDPAFALAPFSAPALLLRAPDLIWLPHPDHTEMLRQLLTSDELWARYAVFPEVFAFGLAVRRDGPRSQAVQQAVVARFRAVYPGLRLEDFEVRRPSGRAGAQRSP